MEWNILTIIGVIVGSLVTVAVLIFAWRLISHLLRTNEDHRAIARFRLQREMLEAKFFDIASGLGKPRGLRWIDCDWEDTYTLARDRKTGLLTAFAAVNIRFEAIEGGDMVDVEAVDKIRTAAAVFHFQRGNWGTGGKALFNLAPEEALTRLESQFEPVALTT